MNLANDLHRDCQALRYLVEGVDDLRQRMLAAQQRIGGRERGYLLADEDDEVRQLFLAYRNRRIALFEIVDRHGHFDQVADESERDRRFLLAFGAAVFLYQGSSLLVQTYKDVPVIRRKLNEPDSRYGIEADLFEQIYGNLTSLTTLGRLRDAAAFYELHRTALATHCTQPPWDWLLAEVDRQYPILKRHDLDLLRDRVARGWDDWLRLAAKPFREASYALTTLALDLFGNRWLGDQPSIPAEHRQAFAELMQPGDFFIVRPEAKSSTLLIPGWWTHCAFYHGGPEALAAAGADRLPHVRAAWDALLPAVDGEPLRILEAISAGVVLNSLSHSLGVDHAVAIRPRLTDGERLTAIDDAFSHLGKAYDFDVDFSRSDRIVCTELIYRSLHGKGRIRFEPRRRYGRPTLSSDDIAATIERGAWEPEPPFDILALSKRNLKTGQSHFYRGKDAWRLFRRIHDIQT